MSKIDELIEQLCPNGADFKEVGELTNILNGYSFKSGKYVKTGIRVIRISDVQKGKMSDKDLKFYPNELESEIKNYLLKENDLVMSLTGNVGRVAMLSKQHLPAGLNQRVACIRIKNNAVLTRFLFHFFDQNQFEIDAMTNATGGGQKNMSTNWLAKYKIPIPPLAIQEEIVNILDKFTTLEAELEAELEARKKQYTFYRDSLLCFEGKDVEWKTLGEVYEFKNGLNKGKEFFGKGTPIVNFTDVFKNRSLNKNELKGKVDVTSKEKQLYGAKKDDLFFTRTSETQEDIGMCSALIDDIEDCVFSGFVLRARPKTKLFLPKFCSYYFTSSYARKEIVKQSTFTTRALTSGTRLSKIKIPIPSLSEQKRIVNILDQLYALVHDISCGLPAEIEARRKQYEYYRNQLLTFNHVSNE